jgi:hypothetical protein
VRREPRRPSAEQKRGAARDVDHAAVEPFLRHQPAVDPVVDVRGVDPVLAEFGVDQHHGNGGVPLGRVGHGAALMPGQLGAHLLLEHVVVGHGHRSTIVNMYVLCIYACRIRDTTISTSC